MPVVRMETTITAGKDKQVETLFEGPRRKLMQITLRNNAVLAAHRAAVPITIQWVAGHGTLTATETAEPVDLVPGVIVTLEAGIEHAVTGRPSVSILLTQFTDR